jgi:hypothetical protein
MEHTAWIAAALFGTASLALLGLGLLLAAIRRMWAMVRILLVLGLLTLVAAAGTAAVLIGLL